METIPKSVFVVVMARNGSNTYEIGLAHEGVKGYTPGYGVCYNPNKPGEKATNYEDASKWVDELNKNKYGYTPKEAAKIVCSTMF